MAKGQHLSSYQQGIVRRYYNHKETLTLSKLQESISDLYVASTDSAGAKAADRKWKWIRQALLEVGLPPAAAAKIVEARDVAALAKVTGELGSGKR